ncbi:heavy-metal-associated domain-containing protein [Paraburkholderia sp. FT54]|jgi:copper chaperone|uniref:heavy-metal-associated domain-containing protein n=1 Tax=Paraburkholderia sp. FT54 TaxID=3074437 RepID=UPI0028774673|nr:heavy-metal-associated domain-containing protein [Paraburkholderia sp. FT54]WNC92425.1 heavy-metal-associated domain-containing protein [Paraburkholderia sp. FT54]
MEFAIPDMSCGGCANAITRAVTSLDPAAKLEVDVPAKIVKLTSTLAPEQLIQAIEAAGFHPSLRA